jgi:hypothetical protein
MHIMWINEDQITFAGGQELAVHGIHPFSFKQVIQLVKWMSVRLRHGIAFMSAHVFNGE